MTATYIVIVSGLSLLAVLVNSFFDLVDDLEADFAAYSRRVARDRRRAT